MLEKAHLRGANCVSVRLLTSTLASNLFAHESANGPVPVLFSTDPDTTSRVLEQDPESLLPALGDAYRLLIQPEHMSAADAAKYLRSKRRAARGVTAFTVVVPPTQLPARKRTRKDPPAGTSQQDIGRPIQLACPTTTPDR
jgi:hypothetical protein